MNFAGEPSDELPDVLATGTTDVTTGFFSLSARASDGKDADYLAWHTLDHRPEQYRLSTIRHAMRLVSTPACRNARAVSTEGFDAVDHVMIYMFSDAKGLRPFFALGDALNRGGRMPLRLPNIGFLVGSRAEISAARRVVAGADVIPWRPAVGVYLVIEEGNAPMDPMTDLPGVAGTWRFSSFRTGMSFDDFSLGKAVACMFLDDDPIKLAPAIGDRLHRRWEIEDVTPLFAGPLFTLVPFEWNRYLP